MSQALAFIGLGVMGYPMAGHLQKAGYSVTVYNRTTEKAQRWVDEFGGGYATTPAEAAREADIVFCCVGNDDDLRSVLTAEQGAFQGMSQGALLVDHTTASANVAREMAQEAQARGLGFLDAPVSGGQAGAENGVLTVMVGGEESAFACAEPVIRSYAKAITLLGPAGSGQLCKMVNQICIAGVLQGLSEGLNFAKQLGVEANTLIEAIGKGAAQSWQMDNRALTMIQDSFDFGFAIDLMVKDLNIVFDTANANHIPLPNAEAVLKRYQALQEKGHGRQDTSVLIKQFD